MIVLRSPKGWTGPKVVDGLQVEGTFRAHQVPLLVDPEHPEHVAQLESWMKSYKAEELFDENGRLVPELGRAGAEGRPADGRQSARQRRHAAARSAHAGLSPPRGERALAGRRRRPGYARAGRVPARRGQAEPGAAQFPHLRSRRDALQSLGRGLRSHQPAVGRPRGRKRRIPRARRPRPGLDAQRASVRGLAGRLSAHRTARAVQQLRGLHSHRRLDVQPARQVAEGDVGTALAAEDRLAELPARLPRLAAGPQRLHAPGSRLPRPRDQQEGRHRPRLSAARCQLPAVGLRSLPAQPALRQRGGGRQARPAAMADDGCRRRALHGRDRHLAMGQQRPGRRAGRGDGLLRRHAHAGDSGRRFHSAPASARPEDPGGQCRRSDEAAVCRASIRTG